MHCALIAYEFPPIPAAQALRWYYLANQLARHGVQIDVLTVQIRDIWGSHWEFHPNIKIHRSYPGPFIGLTGKLARHIKPSTSTQANQYSPPALAPSLSERMYRWIRALLDQVLFPDVRSEWYWYGWRALQKLHAQHAYDIVISSHEPGVDLLLGMRAAKKWRLPWLVDLGDPLLAPYTPRWRCWLDRYVEKKVCRRAQQLIVTASDMQNLLLERHTRMAPLAVIPQGFSLQAGAANSQQSNKPKPYLQLLFTGNFYPGFRDPTVLFAAVRNIPGIHLQIIGESTAFARAAAKSCERIEFAGRMDHFQCLNEQRRATVLVNLGNTQAYQIPGKLYEYLGAQRPILHISQTSNDAAADLLRKLKRGCSAPNQQAAIEQTLRALANRHASGQLDAQFDLSLDAVRAYSWEAAGERLYALCRAVHEEAIEQAL